MVTLDGRFEALQRFSLRSVKILLKKTQRTRNAGIDCLGCDLNLLATLECNQQFSHPEFVWENARES